MSPIVTALAAVGSMAAIDPAHLILSANDGKFVRSGGVATYPRPAPSDSLALIDTRANPPAIRRVIEGIEHSLAGPPQAVAISPDGATAFVAAPSRYDDAARREEFGDFLQMVDLGGSDRIVRVSLGAHPNGLTIDREGRHLLAACTDGTLKLLAIDKSGARLVDSVRISAGRLASVAYMPDGSTALVSLRDEGGLAVVTIDGDRIVPTKERVSTGIAPYAIDITPDGRWAVVGAAGLGGLSGQASPGDADVVTLIDVRRRPFRAVEHLTVPAIPEGVAVSPDGRWLAVQAMAGSNLPTEAGRPQRRSKLILFALTDKGASKVDEVDAGVAGQGVAFAADSRTVLVQYNVERAIAVFHVAGNRLVDSGARLALKAGPASIAAVRR